MNLLILLEDEKYFQLAEEIKASKLITATINNIDFNIEPAIKEAQVVLFLGDNYSFEQFLERYSELIAMKMIVRTCHEATISSQLDIPIYISNGVGICNLIAEGNELRQIIVESLCNIFEQSLSVVITNNQTFNHKIQVLEDYEQQLLSLVDQVQGELGIGATEQVMREIPVKNL